jgi:hypothetical protein
MKIHRLLASFDRPRRRLARRAAGRPGAETKKAKLPSGPGSSAEPRCRSSGKALPTASEKIAAALAAKKLDGVADWAETIHLAAHALEDQIKIDDAERAKRLIGALEQAAKIADDVLDGANHNESGESRRGAYAASRPRSHWRRAGLPKEIVDAPKQAVRFAKSAGHAHDEKGGHVPKKK